MPKIALVQMTASIQEDRGREKILEYVSLAASRGAKFVCFPELFGLPWFLDKKDELYFNLSSSSHGALTQYTCSLAADHGVAIVMPFFEKGVDGVYHNSAMAIDSRGKVVGVYRKTHLPDIPFWNEKFYFTPGSQGFPVFDVDGVRIGIQLGWDNFFPEGFRCLALSGAQLVVMPTAAAFASQEKWLAMSVSHAVANGFFVVRVNRVGSEAGLDFYGNSFAVRPDGELLMDPLGTGEGVQIVDCELAEVEDARRTWPFFKDRQPREYSKVAGLELRESENILIPKALVVRAFEEEKAFPPEPDVKGEGKNP